MIGFGADAVTHGGSGGAAELGISWDQLWDGVPRSFDSPKPDLIVIVRIILLHTIDSFRAALRLALCLWQLMRLTELRYQ